MLCKNIQQNSSYSIAFPWYTRNVCKQLLHYLNTILIERHKFLILLKTFRGEQKKTWRCFYFTFTTNIFLKVETTDDLHSVSEWKHLSELDLTGNPVCIRNHSKKAHYTELVYLIEFYIQFAGNFLNSICFVFSENLSTKYLIFCQIHRLLFIMFYIGI